MPTLYIVATPIGNLEDITLRALRTLKEVDFVLCEDTRVTKKLLSHYQISKPCISYHQHSDERKIEEIIALLNQGKNLALVTDAGTPGISDPGGKLIDVILSPSRVLRVNSAKNPLKLREGILRLATLAQDDNVKIVPIPGPCALTTALSISGFPTDHFVFMGFPPHKKHRKQYFEKVAACQDTVAFYESPYRIIKTLTELGASLQKGTPSPQPSLAGGEGVISYPRLSLHGRGPADLSAEALAKAGGGGEGSLRHIVVCRELTKMFETVYRGTAEEVLNSIKSDTIKGEFVVIVSPKS